MTCFGTIQIKRQKYTKVIFFLQSWNNNSKKGIEQKSYLNAMMNNALSTTGDEKKKKKKKSQTFSQPMLRSIWFWSELCFSDLFLLEVKLKPPAPNTRTLGQFRFSCYLNLVQGASTRHKNNPLTRKPSLEMVPLFAISFEQEEHNESIRCVYLYMYISIQPLSSMCSTWMPAYQMPSFCWVLFFFFWFTD